MRTVPALAALFIGFSAFAQTAGSPLPSFSATALTGETVTAAALIGQPTILIVTPSRGAARDTRQWAKALRQNIDPGAVRIRDVIAVDLPFFISEQFAVSQARQQIDPRYYEQTWLTSGAKLETALGIPDGSEQAFVFVLDSQGNIVSRMRGGPSNARLNEIEAAVQAVQ